MSAFHQASEFVRHWLLSVDRHSLHEPFVFELYEKVISRDSQENIFREIEELRQSYSLRHGKPSLQQLGAASKQYERTWKQLAVDGSTPPDRAQMLVRLSRFIHAKHVVELGTSLGMTALYLSSDKQVHVSTIEGDPALATEARRNFKDFNRMNIDFYAGHIDDLLPNILNKHSTVDLVFIDANHRYEPTLSYFDLLLNHIHENSVLVFDDIHWSSDMSGAWKKIISHPRVTLSLDGYRMGLVFFRPLMQKYHYRISM